MLLPLLCCLLLQGLAPARLDANTRFGFGTIVKVDTTGEDSRKGEPSFVVRFAFRNLKWGSVGTTMSFRIEERTREAYDVAEAARKCIASAGEKFILQPGCEVPPGTPEANLRAFCPGENCLIADDLRRHS